MATHKKARYRFTLEDRLKGIKAALSSRKTPKQLRPSLRQRARELQANIRKRIS